MTTLELAGTRLTHRVEWFRVWREAVADPGSDESLSSSNDSLSGAVGGVQVDVDLFAPAGAGEAGDVSHHVEYTDRVVAGAEGLAPAMSSSANNSSTGGTRGTQRSDGGFKSPKFSP
jgi:hypothetical protein